MATAARKALFLREMPTDLIREAKAVAARRGQTLTAVVAEALARSLGVMDGEPSGIERDMAWYATQHAQLVRRYGGEHVAVVDRAVVDHDADFDALAQRVFAKHGHRSIFMPRVADELPAEVRVRSPRRSTP
jgi:Family of unknown function (DUF5678)